MCSKKVIAQQKNIYNILDFGATHDTSKNSNSAIQKAIDSCAKYGGGTVLIPTGNFATSTIYLKDNIDLHFETGAALYAIDDIALYKNDKAGLQDAGDNFIPSLIVAKKIKNFSITGNGKIIGQPKFYYTEIKDKDSYPGWNENAMQSGVRMMRSWVHDPKISLVYISECSHVLLENINIINSPNWSCHIQWSHSVDVKNIHITSSLETGVNSDGLDIDGCKNVTVTGCTIRTGDDAICLKTTRQGNRSETCENIIVSNCQLSSSSCALKIGTETYSDISRIIFTNCIITNTNRGIGIIVRDGAKVHDVIYSNIIMDCMRKPFFWWGNGEAFHFNVLQRNEKSVIGEIKNITMQNIIADAEGTSMIKGLVNYASASTIYDINLSNITMRMHSESEKDKRADDAVSIQHASAINIPSLHITWDTVNAETKWRHGLVLDSVDGFKINTFVQTPEAINNNTAMQLSNTKNGLVNMNELNSEAYDCKISGSNTSSIIIHQNNKTNKIITGKEVNNKSVIIKNEVE